MASEISDREAKIIASVAWMTGTGKQATVDIELVTSRTINLDGDKHTVPCCEIEITASVEGLGIVGTGEPTTIPANGRNLVACIGKLGLTSETRALVEAAIAEIKASPEWTAKVAAQAAAIASSAQYEAGRERMHRVMGY